MAVMFNAIARLANTEYRLCARYGAYAGMSCRSGPREDRGLSVVSVLTILRGVGCTEVRSPGGLASLCLYAVALDLLDGF
jgi:hypothetical protein